MLIYLCHQQSSILEVVEDLSTETFLLAFRRFVGCQSLPQLMISDNATAYEAAATELKDLLTSEVIVTINRQETAWHIYTKEGSMVW